MLRVGQVNAGVITTGLCDHFITLMKHGWQKSNECQDETKMAYQRYKHKKVTIIPVKFSDFDEDYDESSKQRWSVKFASIQQVLP